MYGLSYQYGSVNLDSNYLLEIIFKIITFHYYQFTNRKNQKHLGMVNKS